MESKEKLVAITEMLVNATAELAKLNVDREAVKQIFISCADIYFNEIDSYLDKEEANE